MASEAKRTRPGAACVYIALGSNLGAPHRQIERGLQALTQLPLTRFRARSHWYRNPALGPGSQPDYINGVALLETRLEPEELLTHLQRIEADQGRERTTRWAARTLDLDILLYGDQVIVTDRLEIPHPRLGERNFVLYPLADISPDLVLPNGIPLTELLNRCPADGLKRVRS
ncbi:2-amino-4-hydroxy-6-hydroxymethyldihydropteridine diphosphokinase [Gilvimarinus sp. F26214L]|uniref:2-amino-4-hydroxy-6- hydroxymethyldihydropteridine diphosphokinase n=1 Tax=Gilvimarinus sp. DZF01 TaxID=3461371 RepID=UPI004045320E